MFGSKTKELSGLLANTKMDLERMTEEKKALEKELSQTKGKLKELEDLVGNSDIRSLEAKAKATIAEYEGLKEMYNNKIRTFEDSRIEEESNFAREAALQRHNLENEISDNRQASQEFVASTVTAFSETYNYYLNQIKVLMDALSQVAKETGETLFQGDPETLKVNFSQRLADALKTGKDTLAGQEGKLIVIGASDEDVDMLEAHSAEMDAEGNAEPEADKEAADAEAPAAEAEAKEAADAEAPAAEAETKESADAEVPVVKAKKPEA